MSKVLVAGFLFILLFTNCNEEVGTTIPLTKEIMPLKIGNYWIYSSIEKDTIIKTHYNNVFRDTTVMLEKWFVQSYDTVSSYYFKNKTDGAWYFRVDKNYPNGIAYLMYKYPATNNEIYTTRDSIKVTVKSTATSITVPAGTFSCYHYFTEYPDKTSNDEYFCPGTGLIKIIGYDASNKAVRRSELKSYKLY